MEESLTREETLKRVVDELTRRGYTENFRAVDGGLEALGSGERFAPNDIRGILVDAFGVYSDPTTSAVLKDVPITGKTAA